MKEMLHVKYSVIIFYVHLDNMIRLSYYQGYFDCHDCVAWSTLFFASAHRPNLKMLQIIRWIAQIKNRYSFSNSRGQYDICRLFVSLGGNRLYYKCLHKVCKATSTLEISRAILYVLFSCFVTVDS